MKSPRFAFLRSLSLIWLVPAIALVASAWLLAREFRSHGPEIEIEFANGDGIEAGKTPLVHKGVAVGMVTAVGLNERLDGVIVKVQLDRSASRLAAEGSDFWLVKPEIGLTGVRGLETILSGTRLNVRAGSGRPATYFRALSKPPSVEGEQPGRNFVLQSDKLNGLNPGAPVHYREVKVGVVENHQLSPDATRVLIKIRVFHPYDRLVRSDSRFWNSGGLSLKISLLGAQVHSDSLESLVAGGVSFATPEDSAAAPPAPEGTAFDLAGEADKDWLKWSPNIPLGDQK
ncbi:MAG TPA: MlaD family protein [Lacunisphaera sp.]|jgi:paraquat-inducible protein B|nr:MlaD family protein [Lacunisphaera sp.]